VAYNSKNSNEILAAIFVKIFLLQK